MRLAAIRTLDRIPLATSAKTNRKTLQTLPFPSASLQKGKPSLTSTERKLAQIWESVLPAQAQGLHSLTAASDFFHVGGNSMSLIELSAFVRRGFDVTLPLLRFFEHSTVSAMASAIHSASNSEEPVSVDWPPKPPSPPPCSLPNPPRHQPNPVATIHRGSCLPVLPAS